LVLGLSIYLAYGYTRSAIGMRMGRPSTTPAILKLAALGFLILAVGLFTVPHDIGFSGVFEAAVNADNPHHGRALAGMILILVGFVLGAAGSVMVATTSQPTGRAK
jgi:uncharacterized membrane protein YidH (DUF202 family)